MRASLGERRLEHDERDDVRPPVADHAQLSDQRRLLGDRQLDIRRRHVKPFARDADAAEIGRLSSWLESTGRIVEDQFARRGLRGARGADRPPSTSPMDRLIGPIRDGPHPRRDGLKNRERTNRLLIALGLRLARSRLDDDTDAAKALLEDASRNLDEAIRELRELARGIHPAVLTDRGLGFALEALAQRMPLPIEVGAVPRERLPDRVDAAACYVVAEAITNVARCAHASHARVDVRCDANRLVVEVADDGVGGADPGKGSGLRGLGDRIAALDGRLDVASEAGRGTTVRALIPI